MCLLLEIAAYASDADPGAVGTGLFWHINSITSLVPDEKLIQNNG